MLIKRSYIVTLLLLFLISGFSVFAQLTVQSGLTPNQLADIVTGPGFTAFNVKVNCADTAIGSFNGATSNIGLPRGILLTTGGLRRARGPNNSTGVGGNIGTSGDSHLDSIVKLTDPLSYTSDGCAIEFDLIPACDTLTINYAFGSEEYPEYVGQEFNDIFVFLVSGPNPTGGTYSNQNIAVVPGTNQLVTVNTINATKNNQYFVNNANGQTIQYDGFTKPLTGKIAVIPCLTYHLKIAIADVNDGIFDAGVFIQENSIQCKPIAYNDIATNKNSIENCNDGSFTFCRTGDSSQAYPIKYKIGGTATNGTDYELLPDSVVIPAGKRCITTFIKPIFDNDIEPVETIEIAYQYGVCPKNDTIKIQLKDPAPFNAGPDLTLCSGDTGKIGVLPDPTLAYLWTPATGLSSSTISNPKISLKNSSPNSVTYTYILSSTINGSCLRKDSIQVTVKGNPFASFKDTNVCIGYLIPFTDLSKASAGKTIKKWFWDFGNSLFDTIQNPSPLYTSPGSYKVTLKVTDNEGCKDDTSLTVNVWPAPNVNFSNTIACAGDTTRFINLSTVTGANIKQSIWNFGDQSQLENSFHAKHVYTAGGKYRVQLIVTSDKNCVNSIEKDIEAVPRTKADFNAADACLNDLAKFINLSSGEQWKWFFGDGATSDDRNTTHKYATPGTKTIKLVASNSYGCKDSIEKKIEVHPSPTPKFYADSAKGCAPFCATFNASAAVSDSVKNWQWIFGAGAIGDGKNATFCFREGGKYSPMLIATSSKGCRDTVTINNYITVYPKPDAAFTVNPSPVSIYTPVVQIKSGPLIGTIKEWNLGDGSIDSLKTSLTHTYKEPGTYKLRQIVRTEYGCLDTAYRDLLVLPETEVFIPNTFTPDGNGKNDYFIPKVSGYLLQADFQMYIFDRWGNKLYTSGSLSDPWDGTVHGTIVQIDTYVYYIIFRDRETNDVLRRFVGHVNVIK